MPGRDDDWEDERQGPGRWLRIWSLILLILLVLVAMSLRITDINVIGNSRYTEEEITDLIFDDVYDLNPIVCFIEDRFLEHKELPFIQDYDIKFHSPFSRDLIVYEKNIVGCLRFMSSYMYFDMDGIVVENSGEKLPGIPEIRGLEFGHIVLNQKLPIEDEDVFSEIMNITQQLDAHGINSDLIEFDASGNAAVVLTDAEVKVELGPNRDIDAKLLALSDMLPNILERGLCGTLDLSSYSETSGDGDVSFKLG